MDKVVASPQEALADLKEGDTVALGGFSVGHRFALSMITALRDKGTKNLTLVCNSMGAPGELRGQILAENKQVKKLIAAFSTRPGMPTATEDQIVSGEMDVELVPQGTLVERCRAGGAGIPAFFTKTGVGTEVAKGKETKIFDGHEYIMERGLVGDLALVKAWKGDASGNLVYRKAARNFNPMMATAAKICIVEVEELVEVGQLDPDHIHTPAVYVQRIFCGAPYDKQIEQRTVRRA